MRCVIYRVCLGIVYASQFTEAHGGCDCGKSQLLAWRFGITLMQQTRPPTNTLTHKCRSTLSLPSFSFFVHLFVSTFVDVCLFFLLFFLFLFILLLRRFLSFLFFWYSYHHTHSNRQMRTQTLRHTHFNAVTECNKQFVPFTIAGQTSACSAEALGSVCLDEPDNTGCFGFHSTGRE